MADYIFAASDGPRSLSALFGDKRDLFLIHNMGACCPHCTMWPMVSMVSIPTSPAALHLLSSRLIRLRCSQRFAAGRGWQFPMVSHQGTSFAADMGYRSSDGGWLPGVSVFRRDGSRLLRVSDTGFHPTDDFCTLWQFLELLPQGATG